MKTVTQDLIFKHFGDMKKLAKSALPFKCACGEHVFNIPDMVRHIKKYHMKEYKSRNNNDKQV